METNFTHTIRAARERQKLSLGKAGELIGISKAHLWELEQGKSCNPSIAVLAGMAAAYEIDVGDLARVAAKSVPGGEVRAAVAKLVEARREVAEAQENSP